MSVATILARSALGAAIALACGSVAAQQNKSTVWWDAAESGWGLYIADQGNVLGSYWFTNDSDGEPAWFVIAGLKQADGSYRGDVQRVTGVPLAQIAGQASDPSTVIGNAQMSFSGDNALSFRYTVNGQTQTKSLKRFAFGDKDVVCRTSNASRATATNYSDIWWNPDSSGWGLHLSHTDTQLIATWYTYDTDREPIFYQGVTTRQADGSYSGDLFRSNNGTPFLQINGAPANNGTTRVGSLQLAFSNGETGSFGYTINGVTQSKPIRRFQFGDTASVCSVEAYNNGDDGGNDGSQGDSCMPPYSVGDVRDVRFDKGLPGEGTRLERIVGTGSFQGQNALVEEISGQTSAGNGVYAKNYVQNGDGTRVSFGAEAFAPATGALLSRSVNQPIRIEQPNAFTVGQSFEVRWTANSTAQGGLTTSEQLRSKSTLLGRETVTVEAGTFTACKFAIETDLDSSVSTAGISTTIRVRRTGTSWTSPQFGLLKMQDTGTTVVSTPFSNTTTAVSGSLELRSATVGGRSTR